MEALSQKRRKKALRIILHHCQEEMESEGMLSDRRRCTPKMRGMSQSLYPSGVNPLCTDACSSFIFIYLFHKSSSHIKCKNFLYEHLMKWHNTVFPHVFHTDWFCSCLVSFCFLFFFSFWAFYSSKKCENKAAGLVLCGRRPHQQPGSLKLQQEDITWNSEYFFFGFLVSVAELIGNAKKPKHKQIKAAF